MRHLSRRYQIRITQSTQDTQPIVEGFEEINVNGRRQTRHWNSENLPEFSPMFDGGLWSELMTPPWSAPTDLLQPRANWDEEKPFRSPRDTGWKASPTPETTNHHRWQAAQSVVKRSLQRSTQIWRNVPAALRAAWRELNRDSRH